MIMQTNETFYAIETNVGSGIFLSELAYDQHLGFKILNTTRSTERIDLFTKDVTEDNKMAMNKVINQIIGIKYLENPRLVKVSKQIMIEGVG